jgi:DNA invertase Pin-like site-specific DNA recombinase
MARIGYARVSTTDQDLDGQLARLKAEGCQVVRAEKVSGASRTERAELATILEFLRRGDEMVVTRLDRLGRNTRDVWNLVHECEQKSAFVTVLDPHVSTRGDLGKIVLTVLGMVAQMDGGLSRSSSGEGIERAKTNGIYLGGKCRIGLERVRQLNEAGLTPTAIAREVRCSRVPVYRIPQGQ